MKFTLVFKEIPGVGFMQPVRDEFALLSTYRGSLAKPDLLIPFRKTADPKQECLDQCSKFGAAIASVSVAGSSEDSPVSGYLVMTQASPEGPVTIRGDITGLAAGPHGFHIHEIGSTDGKRMITFLDEG